MPLETLRTNASSTNQPPITNARARRGLRRRRSASAATTIATRPKTASGSSHAPCSPSASANRRKRPGDPVEVIAPACRRLPGAGLTTTFGVGELRSPSTRPSPLWPKLSESSELSTVPPTYGRCEAGVASTSNQPDHGDGGEHHRRDGEQSRPPAQAPGRADEPAEREPGHDQVGGERLRVEGEADDHGGREQRTPGAALDRAQAGQARQRHQQDQQRVEVVVARRRLRTTGTRRAPPRRRRRPTLRSAARRSGRAPRPRPPSRVPRAAAG